MAGPWTNVDAPPALATSGGTVTLVEGAEFMVCGRTGDIHTGTAQGLFYLDTRFLSRWELTVNGFPLEPLDVVVDEPFAAQHALRCPPGAGRADAGLVVLRRRWLGRGLREDVLVRNHSPEPINVDVGLSAGADFADLFDVKDGRAGRRGEVWEEFRDGRFSHGINRNGSVRAVHIAFSQPPQEGLEEASWAAHVPAQGSWQLCLQVSFTVQGRELEPRYRCDTPVERSLPHRRLARWRQHVPNVRSDHPALELAARQAADDLGVLRIRDPEYPEREVIAAGAPWFMTLFGRDSLLTGWMSLLIDQRLARGVLQTLARFQGEKVDPDTEEEPGRILHEMRFSSSDSGSLGSADIYYGSIDATPLFVMLLGELRRWGLAEDDVEALMPHAERALEWIDAYGDRDGDGYVEYRRSTERGLVHQGWKDSWDGVRFADGRFAEPPIALCEVQAYTYAAFIARAHFAEQAGDAGTAARYVGKAADLKRRFNRDFWLGERGWLAMALDGDKRPVDALTSNIGHCLWAGILDRDKAERVADRLVSPELFSGWGVRTMGTGTAAYNPTGYHTGTVWPHDTAICIAGLMRYGFVDHAHRLAVALLDASEALGGRLPELFCGFARSEIAAPVAYPTSCSPQAWAAAAPLLLVRTLLRFDPWMPHGRLWLAPTLPEAVRRLRVEGIPLGDARVTVEVEGDDVAVTGVPDRVEVVKEPRAPLSAYLQTAGR